MAWTLQVRATAVPGGGEEWGVRVLDDSGDPIVGVIFPAALLQVLNLIRTGRPTPQTNVWMVNLAPGMKLPRSILRALPFGFLRDPQANVDID